MARESHAQWLARNGAAETSDKINAVRTEPRPAPW